MRYDTIKRTLINARSTQKNKLNNHGEHGSTKKIVSIRLFSMLFIMVFLKLVERSICFVWVHCWISCGVQFKTRFM